MRFFRGSLRSSFFDSSRFSKRSRLEFLQEVLPGLFQRFFSRILKEYLLQEFLDLFKIYSEISLGINFDIDPGIPPRITTVFFS